MGGDLGRLRHSGTHSGAGVYRRQCRRPDCLTFLVTVSSGRSKAIAVTVSSRRSKAEWIPPYLGATHLGEPSNGNAL